MGSVIPVRNAVMRRGDHDPANLFAILWACGTPDGESRGGQAEHLEEIAAGHSSGSRITVNEARDFTMHDGARGGIGIVAGLEEERNVPNVVKAERNECALNHSIDCEGDRRTLMHRPMRECINRIINRRPHETEHSARCDHRKRSDDGNGPLSGEEAEIAWKFDAVEAIEHHRSDQARR